MWWTAPEWCCTLHLHAWWICVFVFKVKKILIKKKKKNPKTMTIKNKHFSNDRRTKSWFCQGFFPDVDVLYVIFCRPQWAVDWDHLLFCDLKFWPVLMEKPSPLLQYALVKIHRERHRRKCVNLMVLLLHVLYIDEFMSVVFFSSDFDLIHILF